MREGLSNLKTEARGDENMGAGASAWRFQPRERFGATVWGRDRADKWALLVSRRERELGCWRAAGIGPSRPKMRGKGERWISFFFQLVFKSIYKFEF